MSLILATPSYVVDAYRMWADGGFELAPPSSIFNDDVKQVIDTPEYAEQHRAWLERNRTGAYPSVPAYVSEDAAILINNDFMFADAFMKWRRNGSRGRSPTLPPCVLQPMEICLDTYKILTHP